MKYLFSYLIPISAYLALELLGYWSYSAVILAFVIIPLAELVLPPDPANTEESTYAKRTASLFFDVLLYLNIPVVYFLIYKTLQTIQTGIETGEAIGLFMNLGLVLATAGINVGHEIGHRKGLLNQWAAALLLIPSMYGHFTLEHNTGHHTWVATPKDPATARFNQPVYKFIIQAVTGVFLSAWYLAFREMERKGLPKWHYRNSLIWITAGQLLLLTIYFWWGGWMTLLFGLGAAVMSFTLLEIIDYVEHYGLERKKLPSGKYERVGIQHSWNSDHRLGRIVLYELTRHTDHHIYASRKYQNLRHLENSPQLPFGYPGSILLALVPPLWFRIMNPRVKALSD